VRLKCASLLSAAIIFSAQMSGRQQLHLDTGKQIYQAACTACHGPEGKGMPQSTVGFTAPRTFPDFTQCDQTTPEMNSDWKAVIREGGRFRGFSSIMPAFGDGYSDADIAAVSNFVTARFGAEGGHLTEKDIVSLRKLAAQQ